MISHRQLCNATRCFSLSIWCSVTPVLCPVNSVYVYIPGTTIVFICHCTSLMQGNIWTSIVRYRSARRRKLKKNRKISYRKDRRLSGDNTTTQCQASQSQTHHRYCYDTLLRGVPFYPNALQEQTALENRNTRIWTGSNGRVRKSSTRQNSQRGAPLLNTNKNLIINKS